MLFLSAEFLVFFGAVFLLNWSLCRTSAQAQNTLLLVAGCVFYGWANLDFLLLLIISAASNFAIGIAIEDARSDAHRSRWFWLSIVFNLGLLGYFKYVGFFYESFVDLLNAMGIPREEHVLRIALPLGISFFTFQMVGYAIDLYNGSIEACRKPLLFFTYVFHFPKLLAGPVERAQNFLPRIAGTRTFDRTMASDGLRQLLWGAFAKMVIADNLITVVDDIHDRQTSLGASTLLAGACLYLVQLYADFSGYSNMAIGFSKLLGIPLSINFRSPLFVTNISEFWRKWHISLTSWMMDYLFTPISFLLRDRGKVGLAIAIVITFLAVGIWHGANWTFVVFGLLQGLLFLPLVFGGSINTMGSTDSRSKPFRNVAQMALMFVVMALCFVWMRAPDVASAWAYWRGIAGPGLLQMPDLALHTIVLPLFFYALVEWYWRGDDHVLLKLAAMRSSGVRWSFYSLVVVQMALYASTNEAAFIYFSF